MDACPAARAHVLAPLALGGLVALSLYLRTRDLNAGFWIDEGLSVGIADRPLADIPAALRLDGSPPLYYSLLHVWMSLFGRSEEATHALSLLFALLAIPAAFWAARGVFGNAAGWAAAVLAAPNPFMTQYAQETRMYALVMLLGMLACGAYARAFLLGDELPPQDAPALGDRRSRRCSRRCSTRTTGRCSSASAAASRGSGCWPPRATARGGSCSSTG